LIEAYAILKAGSRITRFLSDPGDSQELLPQVRGC